MKIANAIAACLFLISASTTAQPLTSYYGLTPGRSNKADVEAILGTPQRSTRKSVGLLYVYAKPKTGANYIEVLMDAKTLRVRTIVVEPHNHTVSHVMKLFGSAYQRVRYAFDNCLDDGGHAPIYQSASGNLEFLEYPDRGIYVSIDGDEVVEIMFSVEPPGSQKSRCLDNQPPRRD